MNSIANPESAFFVRSDGVFYAHFGDILLKAETRGDSVVFPFSAIASTPDKDREGETLLQDGLDFGPFIEFGEFNWNHIPYAFVGVPTMKKAWLEDGLWRTSGEIIGGLPIIDNYTTDHVVQQHNALKKAGYQRGLCCSLEGKVKARSKCGRYVTKATVYHIALTFRPINPNCTVDMLAKSMAGIAPVMESDSFYKSLATSTIAPFMKQDLEGSGRKRKNTKEDEHEELARKLVKSLMDKGVNELVAKQKVYSYLCQKLGLK